MDGGAGWVPDILACPHLHLKNGEWMQSRGARIGCASSFTVDRDDETSNPRLCSIYCTQPNGNSRRAVVCPCLLRRCSFLRRQILTSSLRKVGTRSRGR